jgi:hypothetical protein
MVMREVERLGKRENYYYFMFKKMAQFLAENQVENLYTLHLNGKTHSKIYSLTRPILPPEKEVTTFFEKPSLEFMTEEERFEYRMTNRKKVNNFSKSFDG